MVLRHILVVVFLAFVASAVADEQEVDREQDDIQLRKGAGKGANLVFGRKKRDGKKLDFNKQPGFSIKAENIRQTDDQGRNVGPAIRSLTDLPFNVSPFKKDASVQGIEAANQDLRARLTDYHANFTLSVNILKKEGNLSFGDESFVGQKGSIKLLIKVDNFTFCNGMRNDSICKKNRTGKYIEIVISMRDRNGGKGKVESEEEKKKREGPPDPDQRKQRIRCLNMKRVNEAKCPKIFNFPDGSEVALAGQCKVDDQFKPMAAGFPKMEERGEKQLFIFRCPRFNSTLVIDPMVELSEEDEDDGDSDHASSIHLNAFLFFAMLAALII